MIAEGLAGFEGVGRRIEVKGEANGVLVVDDYGHHPTEIKATLSAVKARWPQALVPAPGSHACWLSSVYTPVEHAAAGKHTWEANNLAQKNLSIVDAIPGDTLLIPFELGNWKRLSSAVGLLLKRA